MKIGSLLIARNRRAPGSSF